MTEYIHDNTMLGECTITGFEVQYTSASGEKRNTLKKRPEKIHPCFAPHSGRVNGSCQSGGTHTDQPLGIQVAVACTAANMLTQALTRANENETSKTGW